MSLVQAVGAIRTSGSGTTYPFTIASSGAGNAIIVTVCLGSGTASSCTDNLSQTYTPIVSNTAGGGNLYSWICPNNAGGVTTVTVTVSTGANGCGFVCEESGLVTSSVVDQSLGNGSFNGTSWTTGNMSATTNANDVLYAFAFYGGTSGFGLGAGSGYAALSGTGITAGSSNNSPDGYTYFGERRVVSATGTYAGTGTSSSSVALCGIVFALKQAAVVPPPASYPIESNEYF